MKDAENALRDGDIDLCINLPNEHSKMIADNYTIRRAAVDFAVPLLNDYVTARLFVEALAEHHDQPMMGMQLKSLHDHYSDEVDQL